MAEESIEATDKRDAERTRGRLNNLQAYLSKSFRFHDPSVALAQRLRALVKWTFDFTRNMVIVGAIMFLGIKSGDALLQSLGIAGSVLLLIYLSTYFDTWILEPFHFLKQKKVAFALDFLVNLLIVGTLWIGSQLVLMKSIEAIAQGYLAKDVQEKQ